MQPHQSAQAVASAALLCVPLLLGACGKSGESTTATSGPATKSAPTSGGGGSDGAVTGSELEALIAEFPSLRRLEQALGGAPVNVGIGRSERLEAARAWLAEHRPDLSPREAEFQAQLFAMYEELLDTEDLSLAKATALSESQLLGLWVMDADGDGRLSEEEALAGMNMMMQMDIGTNEYFKDRFDTDGDGIVSDEEAEAGRMLMFETTMPLMNVMIERATLVAWDTNADGVIDDDERAVGEKALNFLDFDGDGVTSDMERMMAFQPLLLEMGQAMVLLEQPDQMALQAEIQAEVARIQEGLMPDHDDFDLDGDGQLSSIELDAYNQAMIAAVQEIQRASMEAVQQSAARFMLAQFDIAINRLDTNDDGALSDEEWEAGYTDLRIERDRKLFNYFYDADRDGRVSDGEVARFMDGFEKRSPYADANLDGRVDVNDLRHFLSQVSGQ